MFVCHVDVDSQSARIFSQHVNVVTRRQQINDFGQWIDFLSSRAIFCVIFFCFFLKGFFMADICCWHSKYITIYRQRIGEGCDKERYSLYCISRILDTQKGEGMDFKVVAFQWEAKSCSSLLMLQTLHTHSLSPFVFACKESSSNTQHWPFCQVDVLIYTHSTWDL